MKSVRFPPTLSDAIASARYERMVDIVRRLKRMVGADKKALSTALPGLQVLMSASDSVNRKLASLLDGQVHRLERRTLIFESRSQRLLARAHSLLQSRLSLKGD